MTRFSSDARLVPLAVLALMMVWAATATRFYVYQSAPRRVKVISERRAARQDFMNPSVVVTAEYNASLGLIGWDTLTIVTNPAATDEDQAYAAGYFEGHVTYQRAWDHYINNYQQNPIAPQVLAFFDENVKWMQQEIAAKNRTSAFWNQVGLLWLQWEGLRDGLNSVAPANQSFTLHKLMALTAMGDLFDLQAALDKTYDGARDWRQMPKREFDTWFARNTHCSALFKVTASFDNIYFGHTAWYNFNTMTRIFKHYTLNFQANGTVAKTISMSSYPGMLSSFDDFYLLDSGFGVIETSLGVMNQTMYKGNIYPQTLPYWVRVMVSNRMTTSAQHWTELIAQHNSGTYNNQYLVLDLNKFTPGQDLPAGTMWIAEQLPGVVGTRDVTRQLSMGYVPSYNVPSIESLFWLSGYGEAVQTQGPQMNDYEMCVRAQIFRRDQATVVDLKSMKHIMQYNDFESDPISNGNPLYAISSRVDLDPRQPQCFGGLDSKISSWRDWKDGLAVHAFSGPSPQQPRFGFNTTRAACGEHVGLAELIAYDWQTFRPGQ